LRIGAIVLVSSARSLRVMLNVRFALSYLFA
jgi:hypothetical protein